MRAFSVEGSFNKINKFIFKKKYEVNSVKSRKIIGDKLFVLKSLASILSKISPEILVDQNRFLPDLSYTFLQYLITCF